MKPQCLLLLPSTSIPIHKLTRQSHRPFTAFANHISSTMSEEPLKLQNQNTHQLLLNKRQLGLSLLLSIPCTATTVLFSTPSPSMADEEEQQVVLEKYIDNKEGFSLLIPSSYVKVDKAGATALFEEVNKGINNVGVVVSPVRLNSLGEFGTPQFVVDKLIKAEKKKKQPYLLDRVDYLEIGLIPIKSSQLAASFPQVESTKDAEVISVAERLGHGGLQVYEFEYKLDSTRGGLKRIFSAAFVASKKLYLLNIAHSDKPESPLDTSTRMMLEQVLHSFDTILST